MKTKVLYKWGYRDQPVLVDKIEITYRDNTTDVKVIKEVLIDNVYQKRRIGFLIDKNDIWLDLGANIGTFSLFVLSMGGKTIAVEPELENLQLLKNNLQQFSKSNYKILPIGVGLNNGKSKLYLCQGDYNKYRHSMIPKRGRDFVEISINSLPTILNNYPSINAIKMDIEGIEIELLEHIPLKYFENINKLVFEYSFDIDRSIPRFLEIINRLKTVFSVVYYTKVKDNQMEYNYFPACTNVYCLK